MIVINVPTFENFKEEVAAIIARYGTHRVLNYSIKNDVLFRGQANSEWELESTLERVSKREWTLGRYIWLTKRIRPIIESYYQLPFSEPSGDEINKWLKDSAEIGVINIPAYDYLLYLRHHGFPSPFVDWSASLYIAAGFAFFPENAADSRAIYMFIEMPEGGKGGNVGTPEINQLGRYIKTHKRHFLQQAIYTICFRRAEDIPLEKYGKVVLNSENLHQDLLWKFIIPSSERESVLRFLESVNISPFSLMPSEENLLTTLWLNEVTLPDLDWAQNNKETESR